MPITIILKDENGKPIIDALSGELVEVQVSEDVALFIEENDSYINKLKHIDEREFELLHYSKRAWENMRGLSTEFSAEDDFLGVSEEIATAERALYLRRLARCRHAYQLLWEACTPTQWRRLMQHQLHGLSCREIARREGLNDKSIIESIYAVRKKIKKVLSKWG